MFVPLYTLFCVVLIGHGARYTFKKAVWYGISDGFLCIFEDLHGEYIMVAVNGSKNLCESSPQKEIVLYCRKRNTKSPEKYENYTWKRFLLEQTNKKACA